MTDGCIMDRLVAAIRRDGLTQAIEDSAPKDLERRAARMAARYGVVGGGMSDRSKVWDGWQWVDRRE